MLEASDGLHNLSLTQEISTSKPIGVSHVKNLRKVEMPPKNLMLPSFFVLHTFQITTAIVLSATKHV